MRIFLVFLLVLNGIRVSELKSVHLRPSYLTRNRRAVEPEDKEQSVKRGILDAKSVSQDTLKPVQSFNTCTDSAHNTTFLEKTIARVKQHAPQDLILYWNILPNNVSLRQMYGIVKMAFRLWSEALPLTFEDSQEGQADILLEFRNGENNCMVTFRNDIPVLLLTFDNVVNDSKQAIAISHALSHSLGHLFGLAHSPDPESIMHPNHSNNNSLFLSKSTEMEVRAIVGPCRVKFNLVVDILRANQFKTYFFNDQYTWLYSNAHQSSIYGGLETEHHFRNLPLALDSLLVVSNILQVPVFSDVFAFKNDSIYRLNSSTLTPINMYSFDHFNCSRKPSSKIQNTYFSYYSHRVYLFENTKVWEYEYGDFVAMKCPRRILTIKQLFHTTSPNSSIASGFDHLYFSHYHRTFFFFKNDELYKAKDTTYWSKSSDQYIMSLEHLGKWWETFPDVCYTDPLNGS